MSHFQQFSGFKKLTIFGIFNLSTQIVNVARFARNVEYDFFYDFQTPWWGLSFLNEWAYRCTKENPENPPLFAFFP